MLPRRVPALFWTCRETTNPGRARRARTRLLAVRDAAGLGGGSSGSRRSGTKNDRGRGSAGGCTGADINAQGDKGQVVVSKNWRSRMCSCQSRHQPQCGQ